MPPSRPASLEEEAERLRAEVDREPQNPKWHFMLGQVYEKQNRLELAELRYRRGAELVPTDHYTGPHYVLGRVLTKQEKWAQARDELQKAIGVKPLDDEGLYLNPDYREAYFLLGVIAYQQHDVGLAESNFKLFLKYGGESSRVVTFFPELVAE
jgi:cytochrome c-type biogenesis protein CcmH/NrfG